MQTSRELVPVPTGSLVVSPSTNASGPIALSLVVPTYNESANIRALLSRLVAALEPRLPGAYELIVVDDDSPDRTWEIALEIAASQPQVRVMRRTGERGLASAVIRGWQVGQGNALAVIDGDLQHPPEVTVRLYDRIAEGFDIAVASRNAEGGGVSSWSMARRIVSRGAQLIGLIIVPSIVGRVSDPMSGYFIVTRAAIAGVPLSPLGYKILIEVMGRGRIGKVAEEGYVFRERQEGSSKVTARLYLEYLRHLVRLRLTTESSLRFFRFAIVGLSGVGVDMALLYLLSDPSQLGLGLTRSKFIAASAAIVNNFFWNERWTFRRAAQGKSGAIWRRFVKFALVCGMGLALNVAVLNVLFNWGHVNRYVANLIAIFLVTVWNYWLNAKLTWNVRN
ncbi:MAG TPA: glycosyltransferase family 2 protein [Polyangiaceae bacterium]|nr:glycosyltransferase family 2 protein [Polyangiaceae bacterium]